MSVFGRQGANRTAGPHGERRPQAPQAVQKRIVVFGISSFLGYIFEMWLLSSVWVRVELLGLLRHRGRTLLTYCAVTKAPFFICC